MKVQCMEQFDGAIVGDRHGRRIGRVVGVRAGAGPYTVDWLVIRVPWRGCRAVPAADAVFSVAGLRVDRSRADVLASPAISDRCHFPDHDNIAAYYAHASASVLTG